MNYQSWHGFNNPNFGYGAMLEGFLKHVPATVELNDKASVNVFMGVPFGIKGWHEGQHRVLFSMWETDTLPKSFIRWLDQYDKILVPCDHNVDLFSQHHDNVSYVPLGVDRTFWKPSDVPHDGVYRFHAGGSLWKRKGLDVVVEAFNKIKLPDAELHIKAAPHAKDVPIGKLGDNIYLHRNWMSLEEQKDWFQQADCYIAASRGEGFGLMPLQSIALGIPTIVSDSTGQSQFSDLASDVVPCEKSRAETIGYWDEPNLDYLCETMINHYNNRETKHQLARSMASKTEKFSWKKATNKLVAALPEGSLLKTDTWVLPHVTVNVTLNRNLKCDIGKESFNFTKGVTYEVSENVYEVLSNAKVLA
jgi:glycosyltransferase involved in cell wall biosynthesis